MNVTVNNCGEKSNWTVMCREEESVEHVDAQLREELVEDMT